MSTRLADPDDLTSGVKTALGNGLNTPLKGATSAFFALGSAGTKLPLAMRRKFCLHCCPILMNSERTETRTQREAIRVGRSVWICL